MTATQAAMIMMSGSADLEDITIAENGEYESVDHDGFGVVTVEVPTMVECAEEVAEILGVDTSQEWDCDDIKTKAQEVVDELEEMQECCDEVVDVIHDYDPTYDPHPVPPDPTNPTIPEKIQEIIDEQKGVVVPDGVDPIPIIEELGAKTGVNTTLDGKRVTFEYVGRGYYPVSESDYTPAQASEPISEYLAINDLYSAFQLAPEPTSAYTYRTWMYSIQIEGFPKYYSFNVASNNSTVPDDNVTGVAINGNNASVQTKSNRGAVFTAASGKSWGTDSELKIY